MEFGTVKYGHLRKWLHFRGVGDYVLATISNFRSLDNITIAIYFVVDSLRNAYGNAQRILSSSYGVFDILFEDNILKLAFRSANNTNYSSEYNVSVGERIFAALTVDSDNLISKRYVNGNLVESLSIDSEPITGASDDVFVGRLYYRTDRNLHGSVYGVVVWSRPLDDADDAEISQMYDYMVNQKGEMITDGLQLWYDGDSIDMANGIWHDKSGNGNDGTIYGATYNSNWGTIKYGTIHYGV